MNGWMDGVGSLWQSAIKTTLMFAITGRSTQDTWAFDLWRDDAMQTAR